MAVGRVGRGVAGLCGALALMTAAAGCGGGAGAAGSSGKAASTAAAKRNSAYVLPTGTPAARSGKRSGNASRLVDQKEIESYLLGDKDVPGYTIGTIAGRTPTGEELPVTLSVGRWPRISPASCQRVYENGQQGSGYRQYGHTDNRFEGRNTAEVALVSYRPADALKVLADLRAALPHCTAFVGPLDMSEGFEHPQLLPDPHLGDEAVEYGIMETVTDDSGTIRVPFHYLVVRKGSVIAWFQVFDPIRRKAAVLPMDVVNAQLAKLP